MTTSIDFDAALDMKLDDVPAPKDPPMGTYVWTVAKPPVVSKSKNGEWSIVEFPIQAVSAESGVDEDALEAYGPADTIFNRISFMAPTAEDKDNDRKKTLAQIRRFIERTLQIDTSDMSNMREMLDGSVNHQFMAQIVWAPNPEDPESNFVNVKNYAPLD